MLRFIRLLLEDLKNGRRISGRKVPMSPYRRYMVEHMKRAQKVPSQVLHKDCNLEKIDDLRKTSRFRIGWTALMIKAYSVLADRYPELRRIYQRWPIEYLYQPDQQSCRAVFSRLIDGQEELLFHKIEDPELMSISEIQQLISFAQEAPIHEIPIFEMHDRFCRLPVTIRKVIWMTLSFSAKLRSSSMGTFGLTTVAREGVYSVHPPCHGNIVVTSGPLQDDGKMRITFVYDHRVHDGMTIARALSEFENIMNTEIVDELKSLSYSSSDSQMSHAQ